MSEEQISFQRHENIDNDLVVINKDKLTLLLKECAERVCIPTAAQFWLGFAFTFATTAFLTEQFHPFLGLSGETIRAVFILGFIVTSLAAFRTCIQWLSTGSYDVGKVIASLMPTKLPEPPLMLPAPKNVPIKKDKISSRKGRRYKTDSTPTTSQPAL